MRRSILSLSASLFLFCTSSLSTQTETAVIQGTVRQLGSGQPLQAARISFQSLAAGASVQVVPVATDDQGRFVVSGIQPGRYRVAAERDGFIRQEFGARSIGGRGMTISIGPKQRLTLEFELARTGSISGRILDEKGHPVVGATVSAEVYQYTNGRRSLRTPSSDPLVHETPSTPVGRATTNDLGEYRLYWLPPGEYFVNVMVRGRAALPASGDLATAANGTNRRVVRSNAAVAGGRVMVLPETPNVYSPVYFPGVLDPRQASPIQLGSSVELRGIDFTWREAPTLAIRGRVVSADASPHVVMLATLDDDRVVTGAQTMSGDAFEFSGVVAGSYRVIAMSRGGQRRQYGNATVDLVDEGIEDLVLTMRPTIDIPGRIIFSSTPTEQVDFGRIQVRVSTMTSGFSEVFTANVSRDGAFVLRNIGTFGHELSVNGLPAGAYVEAARLGARELQGYLTEPDYPDPLEISVGFNPGSVSGVVVDSQNAPYFAAVVALAPEGARRPRKDLYFTASTDQDGRFAFANVPPGSYRLFAWDDIPADAHLNSEFLERFEPFAQPVQVENGAVIDRVMRVIDRMNQGFL